MTNKLLIPILTTIIFLAASCQKDKTTSGGGGGTTTASVSAIACGSGSFSVSAATAGVAYSATGTVPYSGGNGLAFSSGVTVNSTGVTGLTAVLQAGTLANGTGILSYSVSGTPSGSGAANFAISFGGQSCNFPLTVNAAGGGGTTLPSVYNKIYGATSITTDGTWVTIRSNGTPARSVYYPTSDARYQAFSGTTFGGYTFSANPGSISTQNYTFKIPLNPVVAAAHAATDLGPMGVAIDGVPFYNQYNGSNNPLTMEIVSFDQNWGHPDPGNRFHYHVEPTKLTQAQGSDAIMGFLLDGFPVYGPNENGSVVPAASLDAYHGHFSVTADYPAGIYHYHFSTAAPYLNGSGYYGTKGTVTY